MKKEKKIVCICILIMLCLIMCFTGKVEAQSNCKHQYGWIDSKVDHTYHYRICVQCKKSIPIKHDFDENGQCTVCKQIHGKGKMTITDKTYHYYTCKNKDCSGTVKTKHTWEDEKYGEIIINPTCSAKGKMKLECTTHGCSKTKTVNIKKTAHNYEIEKNKINHIYHYKKCSNCGASKAEKHTLDKNGQCKVCKQIHGKGSMTITDKTYHYYTCKNRDCGVTIKTKHTWENKKYATVIKEATCSEKGKREYDCTTAGCNEKKTENIAKNKNKHNYKVVIDLASNPDVKVNHAYHYKKCTWCKAKVAEKHSMQGNICKVCGQIHGIGEIKKTDTKKHYYKCLNESCTTIISNAHKYIIIEKTDHKNHYLKCADCPSIKIEKHNNKGKGKTCSVCGELHTLTVYKTDHEKHYLKCVQNDCTERKKEKHIPNKKGQCTVCKETHKTTYKTDHEYHYIKCSDPNCPSEGEKEKHTPNKNGQCTVCKETHKIISADKNDGYHVVQCSKKDCTYPKTEEEHVYDKRDKKGKCEKCKRLWKNTVIAIQGKLFDLGYYASTVKSKEVDGIVGKRTIKAINDFLELEESNIKINNVNDITAEIILNIKKATKTRTELEIAKTEAKLGPYKGNYQYYQDDYYYVKYGTDTIATKGCGITAMAMVATKLNGRWITPEDIVNWCGNTYYSGGTSWSFYEPAAEKYGIKCTIAGKDGKDTSKVIAALKAGKIVICSQSPGLFTGDRHLIVLDKYNSDGTISVKDPNKKNAVGKDYNNRHFDLQKEIQVTANRYWIFDK